MSFPIPTIFGLPWSVARTENSREVEIRARVNGFLDKRLYTEGKMARAGQPMFQMDRKPFEA